MNNRNFQRELNHIIENIKAEGQVPTLLLHSCCAPCSSYVLEYLSKYFHITLLYYNPNIYPEEEYDKRVQEIKQLLDELPVIHPITFVEGAFDPDTFYHAVEGHEKDTEGGERCLLCYELRMRQAAEMAASLHLDYFTTTLSISPLKHADKINEIGEQLAAEYHVKHLPSDFKKSGGYARSIVLSKIYNLYRQNYCGCVFSMRKD